MLITTEQEDALAMLLHGHEIPDAHPLRRALVDLAAAVRERLKMRVWMWEALKEVTG